jgi:hypothetical protein
MYHAAPAEAADLFFKATTFVGACAEAINEADALITTIAETVEWSSFDSKQRAALALWHSGIREARHALHNTPPCE